MKKKSLLEITPDSPLIERLTRKKELLEINSPAHTEIRPLLIVLGGGMRGVSGGGAVTALNLLGFNQVFDVAIGASAGAPIASYFLAGTEQTYLGTSLFYDELRGHKFINPWHLGEIANIQWLGRTFAEGHKRLDAEAVLSHRTQLYVALTDYVDGYTELFPVKDHPNEVVRMLQISSAIPFLYKKKLSFNGRRYLDGTVAFSVRRCLQSATIASYKPTDIVLIVNKGPDEIDAKGDGVLDFLAMVFSHNFERLLLSQIRLDDDLDYLSTLAKHDINVGVIHSPHTKHRVHNLTTNPEALWELGDETLKQTLVRFGKPELYRPLPKPQKVIVGGPDETL